MRKTTNFLMLAVSLLFTASIFAQSTVTGTVVDGTDNMPLLGVNIVEKGTTNGVSSDFDGNFSLTTKSADATLVVTYIGYVTQEIEVSGDTSLGDIALQASEFGLDEVQIIASVAVDRKTPVAVSTIRSSEIETKLGTQEFPEILKSTPGVYTTKSGGGFGDGRINLRGFESENVAVLINGIPVNDMENGRVYWSNWAGLSDVTSTMQVQRGLGASKVAVPSIGGTINIVTKTTDVEEGGNVYTTLGNDGYRKVGATYSTGLSENGFAATVSASKTDGDGYIDGTQFNAMAYFVNLSKEFNDKHTLAFSAFGAQQRHGQRQNRHSIADYRNHERGNKYNSDWGYKNGQISHVEDNFYHKPQMSLNHYWDINDKMQLSTAAYASFGTGGGGGFDGENKFAASSSEYRIGVNGPINLNKIVDENIALGANGSESILRASRNDHKWYGVLSTLQVDLSDNLELLGGVDYRHYTGSHFYEVTDLLGGQYFADDSDENNPNRALQVGDKYNYYNDGVVGWEGLFAQLEYSKDDLSAFVSLAGSNTSYKRIDYFQYLDDDPLQESDRYNFMGYQVKGGANYNLDEHHNVFANLGYFEKAPGFDAVFINFNNEEINEDAENQKILSFELGYGYRSEKLSGNFNVYRTAWKDRTETRQFPLNENENAFANILGVNAVHQGIELDFVYRPMDKVRINGMVSLGDWRWQNNIEGVEIRDEEQVVVETVDLYIEDMKVSDAAQTTAAIGFNYDFLPNSTLIIDYNYFDNLYADYDPSGRTEEGLPDPWKVPAYSVFDTVLKHGFSFGEFEATLTGRINNVFNTEYIADAFDSTGDLAGTAAGASVYYGFGRTFSVGAKLKF